MMSSTASRKDPFWERLKLFLLLPFFTVALFLIFLVIIFPFYLYRSVIHLIGRCSDIKFSRMVTGLSASLLRDYDVHETKPLSTIVVRVKLRAVHQLRSLAKVRETFRSRVLLKKDPNDHKSLQFPELLQYYKVFMGYVFLVWDRKFDLNNHITEYIPLKTPMSKDELNKLQEDLMVKPFPKERPSWELVFVNNGPPLEDSLEEELGEEDKEYFLFFRIHHGIADGLSVQNLLYSLVDEEHRSFSSGALLLTKWDSFMLTCRTVIRGPYDLLQKLLHPEHDHAFHVPVKELTREYFVAETDVLQRLEAKKIAKHFKVGMTTVLTSVVCGGIRKYLERTRSPVPEMLTLGIPFATREADNTAERLGNDFLIMPLNIPLNLTDSQDRLRNLHELFMGLQNSTLPQMLRVVINALSCLPVDMMRYFSRSSLFSTAYSTLPGPMKSVGGTGWRMIDVNFTYGMGAGRLGLGFSSITYLDKFQFTVFVDRKLMGRKENAKEMIKCVQDEFNNLSGLLKKL